LSLATRLFRSDRSCLLLIVPLSLLLFSLHLGGRDLWAPDEPRAGTITRHIVGSGSWSELRDNGRPYLQKPPLFFWLAAVASLPSGTVDEFTLRLPSSITAVLCVVALFYLGRAMYGRRAGALAAIVLATSQDFFMEARWAHPDMLLCLCMTIATLAFYRSAVAGEAQWRLPAYLALGLALLTKGPVGLLPLLALVVFLAATRNLRFLLRAGLGWGVPIIMLPSAIWLAAHRAATGQLYPVLDSLALLSARVTIGVHHAAPLSHLLAGLPVAFLPWALFLPGAVYHTFPRRGGGQRSEAFVYSFLLLYLAVFAISAERRNVYLLPLMPLLSLLIGRVWDTGLFDWRPSPVERTIKWPLWIWVLLSLAAPALAVVLLRSRAPDLIASAVMLGGALAVASISAAIIRSGRGEGAALAVFAAGMVAAYLVLAAAVLPAIDRHKSPRPFGERIAARIGSAPLGIYPHYHAAFSYYTGKTLEVLPSMAALDTFLTSAPRVYAVVEERHFAPGLGELSIDPDVVDRARVGHRAYLLVEGGEGFPRRRETGPGT
jgi:4-amino-4-deoxy-L-arabinose transferase-like glycosyltransferase